MLIKQNCLDFVNISPCCWKTIEGQWPKVTREPLFQAMLYRFTVCSTVFKPLELQFPECVSVHPVRVLFSWLLPVQIQGCVPFPSYAAPIVLRLPPCLPALWHSHSLWMCALRVRIYTVCVCGIVVRRSRAWKNCSKSFDFVFPHENRPVYPNMAWHLWGQRQIRGDMKKFSHTMMSQLGKKNSPVRLQLLFRVCPTCFSFLILSPSSGGLGSASSSRKRILRCIKHILKLESLHWTV